MTVNHEGNNPYPKDHYRSYPGYLLGPFLLVDFEYDRAFHWDGYLWLKRGELWRGYRTEDVIEASQTAPEGEAAGVGAFLDVPADAWYAGAVNAMAELGLVNGMGAGRFDPNGLLTQEQFLTIMGRMARYLNFAVDSFGMVFEEEDVSLPMSKWLALEPYSDWARTGVAVLAWGREYALGERAGDMLFAPLEEMTPSAPILREEAAAGMYEVLWGLGILP